MKRNKDGVYIPDSGDVVRFQLFDLFSTKNDLRRFLSAYVEENNDDCWDLSDVEICVTGFLHKKVDIEASASIGLENSKDCLED
ncbi:hypothetical protein ABHC39_05245 [Pediococcus acidilactici]|uniref:hypothetical protein n=2 Tax=Pediococcus acidilactici TaxID=1254 RepID=UPI0023305E86|nr:hypothetical protein [Pediococcus acidilactici]MDB8867662.1 hypothetical protein [Pediococcus acidilactici]